jgi:hypothetical protein
MSEWPTIHPERPEPPCSGSMGALPCGCCRQLKLANDKLKSIRSGYGADFLLDALGLSSMVTLSILPVKTKGIS